MITVRGVSLELVFITWEFGSFWWLGRKNMIITSYTKPCCSSCLSMTKHQHSRFLWTNSYSILSQFRKFTLLPRCTMFREIQDCIGCIFGTYFPNLIWFNYFLEIIGVEQLKRELDRLHNEYGAPSVYSIIEEMLALTECKRTLSLLLRLRGVRYICVQIIFLVIFF